MSYRVKKKKLCDDAANNTVIATGNGKYCSTATHAQQL